MKNSILSDPEGWALKLVGSSFRYRLVQSCTLIFGTALAGLLYLICREAQLSLAGYLGVLVFLMIAAVELPLCYLRALRFYVVERQAESSL